MSIPRPTTIEIAVQHMHQEDPPDWRPMGTFPSVRSARASVAHAIDPAVDRLSYGVDYEVRLRRVDGSIRTLTWAQQDWAIESCKAEQERCSIGARLRRGEAVAC